MYTEIKTFEDACKVLNLDAEKVIPDFSLFPIEEQEAMKAHAKLIIIAKAINGDWVPDWTDDNWKYYPWFESGSSSGVGFSYDDFDCWNTNSNVSSHLSKKINTTDLAHIAKNNNFKRFVSK